MREALKQDPTILRDALEAMKDDDTHHEADASRAAILAHRNSMVTPDDPVAGNPKGDITIVEFFDTRCPYCRRMEPTMAQLLQQDHSVRLVYKDLPILGPESVLAAHALLAAQMQNGYEKLRTALMQAPPGYTKEQILAIARKVGLDDARLGHDMDDAAITARIDANLRLARDLGLDGTPALVIGDTLVPGAVELADLEKDDRDGACGGAVRDGGWGCRRTRNPQGTRAHRISTWSRPAIGNPDRTKRSAPLTVEASRWRSSRSNTKTTC